MFVQQAANATPAIFTVRMVLGTFWQQKVRGVKNADLSAIDRYHVSDGFCAVTLICGTKTADGTTRKWRASAGGGFGPRDAERRNIFEL